MSFPRASTCDIWVSPQGEDVGTGSVMEPYKTIAKALSMVTSTRKNIILMPGTYESDESLAWPVGVTDVLITGITPDYESTVIKATAGDEVVEIVPNATIGAANYLAFFANLTIESGESGTNGVQVTDTNMTADKKLIVTFRDCGFSMDEDTDKALVTTHTVACKVKIYMHGRGFGGNNIEGLVYIDCFNAGDRFKANGMNFEGGVQFSTDDVACENEFFACVMKHNGGTGGHDNQYLRANCCMYRDGMTQEPATLAEFADNASELFLSLAS